MKKRYWLYGLASIWLPLIIAAPFWTAHQNQRDLAAYKAAPVCKNHAEAAIDCRQLWKVPVVGFSWDASDPSDKAIRVRLPNGTERPISLRDRTFADRFKTSEDQEINVEYWQDQITSVTVQGKLIPTIDHPDWSQIYAEKMGTAIVNAIILPFIFISGLALLALGAIGAFKPNLLKPS
jgi:hypothetical protein